MSLNGVIEFITYQKKIRDKEGKGLGCKEQDGFEECGSKFFCFDRQNKICTYDRSDNPDKRMDSYKKIVEHYKWLGYKIDI